MYIYVVVAPSKMPEPYHIQLAVPTLLCGFAILMSGSSSLGADFTYEWYTLLVMGLLYFAITFSTTFLLLRVKNYRISDPTAPVIYAVMAGVCIACIVVLAIVPPIMRDCGCPEGSWGAPNCQKCECDSGTCNPVTGDCYCEKPGEDIAKGCKECLPNWVGPDCVECVEGYKEGCTECEIGRDISSNCTTCVTGWTGDKCDKCDDGWWGNPQVECKPCGDCKGGTCLSNDHQSFNDEVCTPTSITCDADADCASSQNCGGRCTPTSREPAKNLVDLYGAIVCRSDDDCGADEPMYYGKCTQKKCCEEARFGDGTCTECPRGRRSPNCDVCPGYVEGIDIVCNGHGACVEGASCDCEDGFSGQFCEIEGEECVEGFYRNGEECTPYPGVVNGNGLTACNGNANTLKEDGTCDCKPEFVGPECGECTNGRYGKFCGHTCEGLTYYSNGTVEKVCGKVWPALAWCSNGTAGTGECFV